MHKDLLSHIRIKLPAADLFKFEQISHDTYNNMSLIDPAMYRKRLQLKNTDLVTFSSVDFQKLYTEWVRLYKLYFETSPGATPEEKFYYFNHSINTHNIRCNVYFVRVYSISRFLFRCLEVNDIDIYCNCKKTINYYRENIQSNIDPILLKYIIMWIFHNYDKIDAEYDFSNGTDIPYLFRKIIYHVPHVDTIKWFIDTYFLKWVLHKSPQYKRLESFNYIAPGAWENQPYDKLKFMLRYEILDTGNGTYDLNQLDDLLLEERFVSNKYTDDVKQTMQQIAARLREEARAADTV